MTNQSYLQFWARALGVEIQQFRNLTPQFSSVGSYVERHGETYLYFFTDLLSGKKIFAASVDNLRLLTQHISLAQFEALNSDTVRNHPFLRAYHLEFNDLDYCLPEHSALTFRHRGAADIRPLVGTDSGLLNEFYAHCSENEKDTLDLRLGEDFAIGRFEPVDRLTSVARFSLIPDSDSLVDLTVVTTDSARGKGYASQLVSNLVQEVLARGLRPKYRVGAENLASVAIARQLGLVAAFQIMSWRIES